MLNTSTSQSVLTVHVRYFYNESAAQSDNSCMKIKVDNCLKISHKLVLKK
ncbi:hypothetical protein X975_08503, partial [Stegodyphus mimosarum]